MLGAGLLAGAVIYYGATSEVAWLFLLGYWIVALVFASLLYAVWNVSRVRGTYGLAGVMFSPADSPRSELPESILRSSPQAVIFEGDQLRIKLGARTVAGARGPVRLKGRVAGTELNAASGLVPKSGWEEQRLIGPVRRGAVQAASWVLDASDPLGLFTFDVHWKDRELGVVLPRFTSLTSRPQVRELEASIAAPRAGSGTEMFGVREYRPGDPLRRIHWRSSARHGELIVREFEPPGVQTVGIFCDPSPIRLPVWPPLRPGTACAPAVASCFGRPAPSHPRRANRGLCGRCWNGWAGIRTRWTGLHPNRHVSVTRSQSWQPPAPKSTMRSRPSGIEAARSARGWSATPTSVQT